MGYRNQVFNRINYKDLDAKQKERFNFQKASAVLADYGFVCLKLDTDWQGADFLAHHINGEITIKIQLKARLSFEKKYENKDLFIMFHGKRGWYLYPHDSTMRALSKICNMANTPSWTVNGKYNTKQPSKETLATIEKYLIGDDSRQPFEQ